jgi:hypothetical protein
MEASDKKSTRTMDNVVEKLSEHCPEKNAVKVVLSCHTHCWMSVDECEVTKGEGRVGIECRIETENRA